MHKINNKACSGQESASHHGCLHQKAVILQQTTRNHLSFNHTGIRYFIIIDHGSRLYGAPSKGGQLKPDLYASKSPSPSRAGGGRVTSQLVTSAEFNNKPSSSSSGYMNVQNNIKPSSAVTGTSSANSDQDSYG